MRLVCLQWQKTTNIDGLVKTGDKTSPENRFVPFVKNDLEDWSRKERSRRLVSRSYVDTKVNTGNKAGTNINIIESIKNPENSTNVEMTDTKAAEAKNTP